VPDNALVFVDESHVTIPQLGGMYRGDFAARPPSPNTASACLVHGQSTAALREWERRCGRRRRACRRRPAAGSWEQSGGVFAEQVIRPTGLIDPPVDIRPARTQVDDLVGEIRQVAAQGYRALVTVLTKRHGRDLTEYLHEQGIRVRYMHSDI